MCVVRVFRVACACCGSVCGCAYAPLPVLVQTGRLVVLVEDARVALQGRAQCRLPFHRGHALGSERLLPFPFLFPWDRARGLRGRLPCCLLPSTFCCRYACEAAPARRIFAVMALWLLSPASCALCTSFEVGPVRRLRMRPFHRLWSVCDHFWSCRLVEGTPVDHSEVGSESEGLPFFRDHAPWPPRGRLRTPPPFLLRSCLVPPPFPFPSRSCPLTTSEVGSWAVFRLPPFGVVTCASASARRFLL
jgi:hypothetical protein